MTGYPTVESLNEGILIVGADTRESLEATTVIVTGRIFLKLVWLVDYDLLK